MQFLSTTVALLLASSASADFVTAKSSELGENVDLGHLEDVNALYSLIGFDSTSNASHWEDVTEFEGISGDDLFQSLNPATNEETGLIKRDDYCADTTGITRMVCENVPSRAWFWGAGGALIIYYAPRALTNWLNDLAVMIVAGRNVRQVWVGGPNGGHDELRRRDNVTAIDYHFSLPYILDSQGKPMKFDVEKRDTVDEDGHETKFAHNYVYSHADETIYYKSTKASFSASNIDPSGKALQARAGTEDYTINMIISKHSSANTIASSGCIANLLKFHLDKSSERNRFACRPIDNKGNWRATMHLMINHGKNNYGTYGNCCD